MKTKIFTLFLFCFALFSKAQVESSFLEYNFTTKEVYDAQSYSSEYFDGKVWFFIMGPHYLYYYPLTIGDDGKIGNMDHNHSYCTDVPNWKFLKHNTTVFNQKLYVFYYNPYNEDCLWYSRIQEDGSHDFKTAKNLNFNPGHKMAAVTANDTLYLFFAENSSKELHFFRGVPVENSDEIHWISDDPVALKDSSGNMLKSFGNIAAETYYTPDNKERIMLCYPSEKISSTRNYLVFYYGIGTNYTFHHQIECYSKRDFDYSAYYVSLAQGNVKGGFEKQYVMQAAYVTQGMFANTNDNVKMFRHEFSLTTGEAGGLEELPVHGNNTVEPFYPIAPDFMAYYVPDGEAKEIRKYLYLVYCFNMWQTAQVIQWESNLLKYTGHVTEFSPEYLMNEMWHPICVVEGPPPFVLNGWTMLHLWNGNKYPPSTFIYGQSSTHTVGSNTIYKKTIEASGGFGPISGGYKRSMQHNNHNSTTDETTLSVKTTIKPPLDSLESEGLMFFFYDGPSLQRSQWRLLDVNGDTLDVDHSLFLFNFTEPQLNIIKKSFTEFSKSPRLNDLYTYVERNVDYFPGLSSLIETQLDEDIGGGAIVTQSIDFDTLYSNTTESTREIKVGINAKYKIFHLEAGYTETIEYTTENNTENKHGFELTYNNPAPLVPKDTTNVISYNTIAHLMQVTDTSVYFYPGGFDKYKPLFVTWEVSDIVHGPFTESINDKEFVARYRFRCYPNPASTHSTFAFKLPEPAEVQLTLINATGTLKKEILNTRLPFGSQSFDQKLDGFVPGLYFYTLRIGGDVLNGKLMIIQ
jgi:hypothetical protein